jgi:hypothetical protein
MSSTTWSCVMSDLQRHNGRLFLAVVAMGRWDHVKFLLDNFDVSRFDLITALFQALRGSYPVPPCPETLKLLMSNIKSVPFERGHELLAVILTTANLSHDLRFEFFKSMVEKGAVWKHGTALPDVVNKQRYLDWLQEQQRKATVAGPVVDGREVIDERPVRSRLLMAPSSVPVCAECIFPFPFPSSAQAAEAGRLGGDAAVRPRRGALPRARQAAPRQVHALPGTLQRWGRHGRGGPRGLRHLPPQGLLLRRGGLGG